ncbi:hypothetical protein SAMN06295974_3821 [Plantibacter flavus]|uniref:Uncharacterized protein n=1 Tax=Plantibacter flavus TaxID=150123 RepID=A0A3N2BLI1_9MICO|nr:hypothetical protein [Plantibacter flavus]ROR76032.1 hypothetical protein EDD42_3985 [Plantibacter flavus]SMG49132.1 hypothetical protein SAMN06295974_3821 [Plantibacter flavus]
MSQSTQAPHPIKQAVTAKTANFLYYDIESLNNVFSLCAYSPRTNSVEVFFLVDPVEGSSLTEELRAHPFSTKLAAERIIAENPAFQVVDDLKRTINFHDLSTWLGNYALAQLFGVSDADSVNDPDSKSQFTNHLRPVCDTDPGYDPFLRHPYFVGYNSFSYDTTMLAAYFLEALSHLPKALAQKQAADYGFQPPKASIMRTHNDELFKDTYISYMPRYLVEGSVAQGKRWNSIPNKIRQAMINSGRHIDAARLNEAQQFVGLKRLLGGLGRQIMESDKLGAHNATVETVRDLYDLLAYNVSDVVGLAKLFQHPTFSSAFDLKKGLIDEYPETIYERSKFSSAPNISPKAVRKGRLTPDSSSAKLVGLILSPYGHLNDIRGVSFMYPSEMVAKERGIERVNVLDECRTFFYDGVSDPAARAQFDLVYAYYKSIEGKNFNASEEYADTYPDGDRAHVLSEIPKAPNNLPYFHADGSPSTCFATFSTGGIHGAEADWGAYGEELLAWSENEQLLADVKAAYPDPLVVRTTKGGVTLPNGRVVQHGEVLTAKATIKALTARSEAIAALGANPSPEQLDAIEQQYVGAGYKPAKPRPELFEQKVDGSTKLKPKYAFTSMARAIHEDFTSYYPNMLRNMSAFYNADLGEDRYAKILADKDRYGREMKIPGLSPEEKTHLGVLRNGTKLILNSASGAGDTTHTTPIRVNNAIISMRIIGQLFSWRIGQAQTLAGARIISTNTDGLYSVLDEETNNRVLAEQQALINVEIEPEPLIIVSKDSNNRLELEVPEDDSTPVWEAKIVSASGGTLACHQEPQPTKSLAHPAVLDWALARYLRYAAGAYVPSWRTDPISLAEPLDRRLGKQLLLEAARDSDPVLAARLFQNVVVASNGKVTIPFASDPVDPSSDDQDTVVNPRTIQHYNRMFIVHEGKPGAVSLRAAGAWVVNAASKIRRSRDGVAPVHTDPVAMGILKANGFARDRLDAQTNNRVLLPEDQDVAVRKITGIDPAWNILIENGDLLCMGEDRLRDLLGCLDLDVYLDMLASTYEKNWKNSAADAGVAGDVLAESSSQDDELAEDGIAA